MLSVVVAFDQNMLIGNANELPWHYKDDLLYFKNLTLNHKLIMGDNTFQSILGYLNAPLKQRVTIVVTDKVYDYDNVICYDNLDDIIAKYQDSDEEIFVCGGRSIYEQLLPYCKKLYITHINKSHEGDVYFPKIDWNKYQKLSSKVINELDFSVYEVKR